MPVQHTNRKGQTYFLHEGRTPKGSPKYYFSQNSDGNLVKQVPDGFEIYEKPDSAQPFLRRQQTSRVTAAEREFVLMACREVTGSRAVIVDLERDSIIVYFAERNEGNIDRLLGVLGVSRELLNRPEMSEVLDGHYEKLLRFTLVDEQRRLYSAERWCFRGRIDNWIPIGERGPLDQQVRTYARHLGQESYFELM